MDIDYNKLPPGLGDRLNDKLRKGEPFRLEITPDKFVLEQPDCESKVEADSSGFGCVVIILGLFLLLDFLANS